MITKRLDNIFSTNVKTYKESKSRRALDFIGNAISYISGIPSPGEWRLNTQNVANLKQAMHLLNEKGDLEGARIDISNHHIAKLHEAIIEIALELNKTISQTNKMQEGLEIRLLFEIASQGVLSLLDNMENVIDTIVSICEKGRHNMASLEGLDRNFLISSLRSIQDSHKVLTPIFGSSESEFYYEVPLSTVSFHDKAVWVSLRIPLVNFNNKYLKTNNIVGWEPYVETLESLNVVNPQIYSGSMNRHTIMGKGAMDNCKMIRKIVVCEGRRIIIGSKFSHEGNIMDNYWAESDKQEHIAFVNNRNMSVQIRCGEKRTNFILGSKGLLYLSKGCSLKGERIEIEAVRIDIPMIDKRIIQYKIMEIIEQDHIGKVQKSLGKLENLIGELRNRSANDANDVKDNQLKKDIEEQSNEITDTINEITISNVTFFGGIATIALIILVVTCILCVVVKKLCKKIVN